MKRTFLVKPVVVTLSMQVHVAVAVIALGCVLPGAMGSAAAVSEEEKNEGAKKETIGSLETQFRELPMEARRLSMPIFWMHGDSSRERLEEYVAKVVEGGNGAFLAWAGNRLYHEQGWPGENWYRDLKICLEAAKKHDLKVWITDDELWPSQTVGGKVPPRLAAKKLIASAVDVEGPRDWNGESYGGERYVAALAGRLTDDGKIAGDSLVDLAPFVRDGKISWQAPAGKWRIMKFTHVPARTVIDGGHAGSLTVDGASKESVDWYLQTLYQWYYDHFKDDFGKTLAGLYYDEPETLGDWGTELNRVLEEWKVDWKKAYVAYKFELAGAEQIAARYQYFDAFAEAWGRTMFGGMTNWCHEHGIKSAGHFMEHGEHIHPQEPQTIGLLLDPRFCAGNIMRLQGYSDMGGADAVFKQFKVGERINDFPPTWQLPKLASSISHVYGKQDDLAVTQIFGATGQDLIYSEMKWWADHFQVSGVNFMNPSALNVRAPYATRFPPYFYNGGDEPRWPLYRVYSDYTNRLSLMLTGGRHICPVALLFVGISAQVGRFIPPDDMSTALQDAQIDCDWMPYDVFERDSRVADNKLLLHKARYKVLIVPPVEVIPPATLTKVKAYFEAGGVVLGYGFLPSKSATLGHEAKEITALCTDIWGESPSQGLGHCRTSAAGGRSYFLPETPTPEQLQQVLADASVPLTLEVLAGETSGWLHVLHRVKAGNDIFMVCNQNHEGAARQFKFRTIAAGEPECWDAMRNEVTAIPFHRVGDNAVEFSLSLEPMETVLVIFQTKGQVARPLRIQAGVKPILESIGITRDPNPANTGKRTVRPVALPDPFNGVVPPAGTRTVSPVAAADPFRGRFEIPADVDPTTCRICLEMDGLPDDSAAVTVNGVYAGGVIGRPLRLDITRHVKSDENAVVIEPLAPKSARIVFYNAAKRDTLAHTYPFDLPNPVLLSPEREYSVIPSITGIPHIHP